MGSSNPPPPPPPLGGADAQGATLFAAGPGLDSPHISHISPIYLPCISPVSHQASTVLSPYHTELLNVASAAEVTHEAIMKQLEA